MLVLHYFLFEHKDQESHNLFCEANVMFAQSACIQTSANPCNTILVVVFNRRSISTSVIVQSYHALGFPTLQSRLVVTCRY